MNLHLFGASSLSGNAFLDKIDNSTIYKKVFIYSSNESSNNFINLNLENTYKLREIGSDALIISFAPIWYFAKFIERTSKDNFSILANIKGLIVCSSSSSQTKKFESNKFDKNLSKKLEDSEETILRISKKLDIKCLIIQPSLIYGSYKKKTDQNISLIIKLLKILPFIFLPKETGLRQPIHINQLASVFNFLALEMINSEESFEKYNFRKILLGGDEEISYENMIIKILNNLNKDKRKVKCHIFLLPLRLFLFLFSPLLLISPKLFDSIKRINSDLAGFSKANEIVKKKKELFPSEPLN